MGWREWTGVGERRWKTGPDTEQVEPAKTLWNWLQLLIVPAMLVAVTFAWSALQTNSDNRREDRRLAADSVAAEQVRQDATLNAYLQQMSDLMLHENLLVSKRDDAVRSVARTVTLTALRRLDGERRGEVVRFLQEARLIRAKGEPRVSLAGANLTGANLSGAIILESDLGGADLRRANLKNANIHSSWLYDADLTRANLAGAYLPGADLTLANLTRANLAGAALFGTIFGGANLRRADLRHADLKGADLSGANLTRAKLTGAYLYDANLDSADLIRADLTRADLTEANLTDADLTDATFTGTKGLPRGDR